MNLLLDTCTFLWITLEPARLSSTASILFADPTSTCHLSAVSSWEIAVQYALGQLTLVQSPTLFVPQQRILHQTLSLPLDEEDACLAASLLTIHKAPSTACSSARRFVRE